MNQFRSYEFVTSVPWNALGETDIAMLEDSDESFLLDSIGMLLTWIFWSKIVRHQLWNYQYVTIVP